MDMNTEDTTIKEMITHGRDTIILDFDKSKRKLQSEKNKRIQSILTEKTCIVDQLQEDAAAAQQCFMQTVTQAMHCHKSILKPANVTMTHKTHAKKKANTKHNDNVTTMWTSTTALKMKTSSNNHPRNSMIKLVNHQPNTTFVNAFNNETWKFKKNRKNIILKNGVAILCNSYISSRKLFI
jgi:hypothetical protein